MIYNKNEIIVFRAVITRLQSISAFPESGKPFTILRCLKGWYIFAILGLPLLLGMLGRMYQDLKEKRLFHVLTEMYVWNLLLMFYSIILIITYRGNAMVKFLKDFSRHKHGFPKHFRQTMKDIDKATNILYYGVSAIIIMLCIKSYTNDIFCNSRDFLIDHHYICGSFVPVWYPVTINIPMVKQFFLIYSMCVSLYSVPSIACAIVLIYGSMKLIVIRIEELKVYIRKIDFKKDSLVQSRTKMVFCVDYYIEISKLVRQVNDTIGYAYAPSQNANWDIMLGLLGYQAAKQLDIPAAIQFVAWIAVEGMVCFAGQQLENASSSLQEELYNIPWYDMQPQLRSIFRNFQTEVNRTLQFVIQPNLKINMQYFKRLCRVHIL